MKFLIAIIFIFVLNINHVLSDNLYDALKIAYKNLSEDLTSEVYVETFFPEVILDLKGKKRDDLQEVIQLIKDSKIEIPLNYGNFRD